MGKIISKKIAEQIMKIEGEIRGVVFKTDVEFILKEKGITGLKKIEEEMKNLGHPLNYKEIKTMEFYPIGLRIVSLLVIKQNFNLSEKKIEEMGSFAIKSSLLIRILMNLFLNFKKIFFSKGPELFKKFLRVGEFIPVMVDDENKTAIIRFKDLDLHPVYCAYLRGGLSSFFKIITGSKTVSCQES